ncbi:hypothetical protein BH23ACT10_BH23ACT10_24420 [soil metagenome]
MVGAALITLGICNRQLTVEEHTMGIGSSIALIAIGAIMAFALDLQVAGIDIRVIGYILMAAGLLGLLFTALIFGRRESSAPRQREVVRERERKL